MQNKLSSVVRRGGTAFTREEQEVTLTQKAIVRRFHLRGQGLKKGCGPHSPPTCVLHVSNENLIHYLLELSTGEGGR